MRKIFKLPIPVILVILSIILLMFSKKVASAHYAGELKGYILLQVESKGEAWYVYPIDGKRYYLGRPNDAFRLMKALSLGVKHDYLEFETIFPDRLAGMILLDTEKNGEAYYIYPKDKKKYYLGRPADAFSIMRELGEGITNTDLVNIPVAEINEPVANINVKKSSFIDNVPFTSQAPFGNWQDERFQNGCEEASALMAIKWANGQTLSRQEANDEIIKISRYLKEKYKESRDASSQDTIDWIFKGYFGYNNVRLTDNISIDDIIKELDNGHLVITPMNGQIMHNSYYTPPGPPLHMVVIRGYDSVKKQFITNDPGTRHGELFRYDAKVLYEAIRDYHTGYHQPINRVKKNMIVVWK